MGTVESLSSAGGAQNPVFQRFHSVMAVTQAGDEGCSEFIRLGAFCVEWGGQMQEDARDSLEVFKFNLIEGTIGRWLRAVIVRLEEKRSSIRRNRNEELS
jgi:hypothetical protein